MMSWIYFEQCDVINGDLHHFYNSITLADYKLLVGSNQIWPNVPFGTPLPALSDCCVIPQWLDSNYTTQGCVPPPTPGSACKYTHFQSTFKE